MRGTDLDLTNLFASIWPFVVSAAVVGGVVLAFTRCAVAHVAVVVAAHLYSNYSFVQCSKREEWLQTLQEMTAGERPAHAGTLLWAGAVQFVRRWLRHGPVKRFLYARAVVEFYRVIRGGRSAKPPSRWWLGGQFINAFRKHTHTRALIEACTDLVRIGQQRRAQDWRPAPA